MKIHLSHDGRQSGPFTETELHTQLAAGEISAATLARIGSKYEWQPLDALLRDLPAIRTVSRGRKWRTVAITLICLVVGVLSFSLAFPQHCLITAQANQMKGSSNCKQIIGLLLAYASENCSIYPDSVTDPATGALPLTSNDAFRKLFQEGLTQEEKLFGCPATKFNPDTNIGVAPAFEQALTAGENHWALTQGQSNTSTSIMPLVFENPVTTSWPPQWNADAAGKPIPGRAWAGGKIIVGKNDGTVETVKLQASSGAAVGPRMLGYGVDMFTQASDNQPLRILNIAIGGTGPFIPPPPENP
ncbi:MAG TPA: GYF domain-containing protein [Prosthecobacter sp.]|nr:GYF domain-containing protein [Prosthecobacter sp.]